MLFERRILALQENHADYLFDLIVEHIIPLIRAKEEEDRSEKVAADDLFDHSILIELDCKTCKLNQLETSRA